MPKSSQGKDFEANSSGAGNEGKLLLFDLFFTGHHPGYILHLVKYWREQKLPGSLDVLVTPKFIQLHPDVVSTALDGGESNINFLTISSEEEAVLKSEESSVDRLVRAFQEWHLLHKYTRQLEATQVLLMYFDSILLSLAFRGRFPCPLYGIYFRPIFHYKEFAGFTPSRHERFLQVRDKFALSRVLRNPSFQTLFCLDPFAVEHINKSESKAAAVYLPDPVQIYNDSEFQLEELRKSLGIQADRQAFLFFGVLNKRKGIHQLLEAITLLPPPLCEKLCLLLIGPLDFNEQEIVQARLAEISQFLPVQIICRHKFVTDREIQPYFQIADVVLAPYQHHIGMSAILVRAAAAQKPVLSSDYGLMGEITRRYGLGLAVDSTLPSEIAEGFKRFLLEAPARLCDKVSMERFADQNKAEKFAQIIFQKLEDSSSIVANDKY
jgi:glycosyltransferase involved in cell wall biosynthesis